MTVTAKVLVPAKVLENAQTVQYTVLGARAVIDKATCTNTTGNNVTLSVNLVTATSSAGASNLVINAKVIFPGETYLCPELVGHVLEPGGFISTLAGASGALTFRVSGREIA